MAHVSLSLLQVLPNKIHWSLNQSILVQIMTWCRQATGHYLSQSSPRCRSTYGITRPQKFDACKLSEMLYAIVWYLTMELFVASRHFCSIALLLSGPISQRHYWGHKTVRSLPVFTMAWASSTCCMYQLRCQKVTSICVGSGASITKANLCEISCKLTRMF